MLFRTVSTCACLLFICSLPGQSGSVPELKTGKNSGIVYRVLGFDLGEGDKSKDGSLIDNRMFQKVVKLQAPFSHIMIPAIGEHHFTEYPFVDARSGIFKYAYFLETAELYPSLYMFESSAHKGNIRLTFGSRIRVWNKRRPPLRSYPEWEPSNAILTPSFMPAIHYSRLLNVHSSPGRSVIYHLELGFTHHSNGQDAPTLNAMDTTLLIPDSYLYNIHDGDFSTNYMNIAVCRSVVGKHNTTTQKLSLILDGLGKSRPEHEALIKYKLSYRYRFFNAPTSRKKGRDQKFRNWMEGEAGFGLVSFSEFDLSRSISCSVSYYHHVPFSLGIYGFFNYAYMGQDNYNIYLENRLHLFRFGIANLIN